jgi:formylglycine-generating enzyme required for sulfatase activity
MNRLLALVLGLALTGALAQPAGKPAVIAGDGVRGPAGMVWVPGGEFLMGSDH